MAPAWRRCLSAHEAAPRRTLRGFSACGGEACPEELAPRVEPVWLPQPVVALSRFVAISRPRHPATCAAPAQPFRDRLPGTPAGLCARISTHAEERPYSGRTTASASSR